MIAGFIGYGTETLALLLARPEWSNAVTIELQLPTDVSRAPISTKESRRTFAQSSRYSMQYRCTLDAAAKSSELRIFLERLKTELLAVPLWTDGVTPAATIPTNGLQAFVSTQPVRYGAEWIILANDNSRYEIITVSSVTANQISFAAPTQMGWTIGSGFMLFPLMFGRLTERPKPEALTDEALTIDLKVQENSAFARRLNPFAGVIPTVGPAIPGFTTVPLLDVQPNWNRPIDWTEPDIVYSQTIGFSRTDSARDYNHPTPRGMEQEFYQIGRDQIARLERLFVDRRANVRPFMAPTFQGNLRLMSDVSPGGIFGSIVSVEADTAFADAFNAGAHPGLPFIALVGPGVVDPQKIDSMTIDPGAPGSTTSTGVLFLDMPLTQSHAMLTTKVSSLLYARLKEAKLTWSYTCDEDATTRLQFMELVNEYAAPPPNLPEPVFLYRFTENLPTPQYYYFTSYENAFAVAAGVYAGNYTPAPFSHQLRQTGLKLEETLELKSFPFAGNPLAKFFPFGLNATLTLDLLEADAANPGAAPVIVYSGDVWDIDPTYKATCKWLGNFFKRRFHSFILGRADNGDVYSGPLQVNAATFKVTGAITVLNGRKIRVNGGISNPTDYFSAGFMDTGAGAAVERRSILHSEVIAGVTELTLDRPLLSAVVGQNVDMYPGYDGSIDTRDTKFGDRIDFLAHAFVPDTPPNVKAVKAKQAQGGFK